MGRHPPSDGAAAAVERGDTRRGPDDASPGRNRETEIETVKFRVDNRPHMLKKLLAKVRIGAATAKASLGSRTVRPGGSLDVDVAVEGGDVEQEVAAVDLAFETRYATDDGHRDATIDSVTVAEDLTVGPDHDETVSATLDVPYDLPLTVRGGNAKLETTLRIRGALGHVTETSLDVEPTERMEALFEAAESLGLSLRSSAVEEASLGGSPSGQRFVQEVEFRATGGEYADDLDELEFVLQPGPDALDAVVEVDRSGGLLSEMTDMDESKTSVTVTDADPDAIADQLREAIEAEL